MMKLYDYLPSGNSYKVRLLLAWLDIGYHHIGVDIHKGETQTEAFLRKNPAGQIPVLELGDGRLLAESNAILFFLAQNTLYWPDDIFEQAKALQWLFFEQYKHEPTIAVARFIHHYAMDRRASELQGLMPRGYEALDVMESHLAQAPWFVGGGPTIADIALYAYTHVADEGGFDLSGYPHIRAWLDHMRKQPRHILITDRPT